MDIYVPIDVLPVLTSGRNSLGAHKAAHPPLNLLDNNMDTYQKPLTFSGWTLHIDIGINPPDVDTVILWMHNYNENYENDKLLSIIVGDDDITYPDVARNSIRFPLLRVGYTPLAIIPLEFQIWNKRYWEINFGNFDDPPQDFTTEISGIWFCKKETLSHEHQKPEQNIIRYQNRKNITKSGIPQNEPAGIGSTSSKNRKFISTNDANYFDVLKDLYSKCRGNQRPFFMIPDISTGVYHALNFTKPFADNEIDFQYHDINLSLSEIGHEKIPFQNRKLYPLAETVGLWRFRDLNGTDESGSGNDLTNSGFDSTDLFSGGVTEQGITFLKMNIADNFNISLGAPSSDFEMDISDFTVEAWVLMDSNIAGEDRGFLSKFSGGAAAGWRLTSSSAFKWGLNLGDGSTHAFFDCDFATNDNKWHLMTGVVDRTADTLDWYIDGIFQISRDISAMTGNISQSNSPLTLDGVSQDDMIWWDEICVTKRKLTADEILNRYNGREDLGEWGR